MIVESHVFADTSIYRTSPKISWLHSKCRWAAIFAYWTRRLEWPMTCLPIEWWIDHASGRHLSAELAASICVAALCRWTVAGKRPGKQGDRATKWTIASKSPWTLVLLGQLFPGVRLPRLAALLRVKCFLLCFASFGLLKHSTVYSANYSRRLIYCANKWTCHWRSSVFL